MKTFILRVWGVFGCFSQLKVERFSYLVITPSAARGIFDAIFCKPIEFRWQIKRVEILSPISYVSLARNEVKDAVPSERTVLAWKRSRSFQPIIADGNEEKDKGRTQRQTMALKNLNYLIHAEIRPWHNFENRLIGLQEQFVRRASQGKCFCQPCFGCREFPAFFELMNGQSLPRPLPINQEVGLMLYDVFDLSRPGKNTDSPAISLFRAEIKNGIMEVPEYESDLVLKPERS